jgi:hypothetical protein
MRQMARSSKVAQVIRASARLAEPPNGELVTIRKAAQILGMNTSSIQFATKRA